MLPFRSLRIFLWRRFAAVGCAGFQPSSTIWLQSGIIVEVSLIQCQPDSDTLAFVPSGADANLTYSSSYISLYPNPVFFRAGNWIPDYYTEVRSVPAPFLPSLPLIPARILILRLISYFPPSPPLSLSLSLPPSPGRGLVCCVPQISKHG